MLFHDRERKNLELEAMSPSEFEHVRFIPHEELVRDLLSGEPRRIAAALYGASRYDEDWEWVQSNCLLCLRSTDVTVRRAAATCLGDLAFFFRRPINAALVLSALKISADDPTIADPAQLSISLVMQAKERGWLL
jgi:hypothetical protein